MKLPASATLADAPALLQQVQQGLAGGGSDTFCIDASALQEFDTSALALLMQAHRLARAAGRRFDVVGAPPKLAQLAALYGVEELLSLSASASASAGAPAAA